MKKTYIILICTLLLVNTGCGFNREVSCNCNCCISSTQDSSQESSPSSSVLLEEDSQISSQDNELTSDELVTDNDYLDNQTEEQKEEEKERAEKEEKEKIYQEAKEDYLSGKWDGMPKTIGSHSISFSKYGEILLDNYLVHQERLDLPEDFDCDTIDSNTTYIPGHGIYAIKDNCLVKYVRGELVSLEVGSLDCKGWISTDQLEFGYRINGDFVSLQDSSYVLDYFYIYDELPYLYYCPEDEKLLLVTTDLATGTRYLYLFPDYNVSKTQFLGEINNFCVSSDGSGSSQFTYEDTSGNTWEYSKGGPKKLELD